MPGYLSLAERNTANVRKALMGSVWLANGTAAAPTKVSLFDATTGALKAIPAGYSDVGWLTDAGAKKGRAVTATDITGFGSTNPLRTDITKDTSTLTFECQETKIGTLALSAGVDPSTITPDPTNGTMEFQQALVTTAATFRVLVFGVDLQAAGEFDIVWFFPRMSVTGYGDQSISTTGAITYPFTMTAYPDPVLGYPVDTFLGGDGNLANVGSEEVLRTVTVTTNSTTALVATTGTFTTFDTNRHVSGAGIPVGATITFVDSTHATLSAAATASATGVALSIV